MKRIIVAVILAALAGQASATIGSVISSFYLGQTTLLLWPSGIYRDSSYVYHLFSYADVLYLDIDYPNGERYRDLTLLYPLGFDDVPGAMTGCHLGAAYFAFAVYGYGDPIYFATLSSASIVGSFNPADNYDIMWDGRYYHVNTGNGVYDRYTTAGAPAGQWTVAGWPAGIWGNGSTFSKSFNYASGRYLFVAGRMSGRDLHCTFNMDDGSLVASFSRPTSSRYCFGQNFGDAYPARYGGAIWYHGYFSLTEEHWAYQIDVDARGATNVVPASVGKIKAIYR